MGEMTRRIRASGGLAREIAVDGPRLTALCDGYLDMDLSRFPDVVRGVGDDLAMADGQDLNDMTVSVNAFLIQTDDRLCLVDAGDGSRRGAHLGHLLKALRQAGYAPGDVTDLFMTHLHGDHAAGLVADGRPVYPIAALHVAAEEIRFWRNPAEMDAIQASQVAVAVAAMETYRERLIAIHPGDMILPGVLVRALPGHTPGQVGYQLGQRDPVLISADVLHLPALQVKHPEWGFLFDADRPRAQTMRLDLLAETSESGLRLAGAHIPFPGVIRVGKRDDGLAFEATDG